MKVILCLSFLVLATVGYQHCPEVNTACDREMVDVMLKFKGECCGNKWFYQIFADAFRSQASEIMSTDLLGMGTSMMFGGLSKDVDIDPEDLKEMDAMVCCIEKQFNENQAYKFFNCTCDNLVEASRGPDGKPKCSKLGCLGQRFIEACPEVMADLKGDYSGLASKDNFAYPSAG